MESYAKYADMPRTSTCLLIDEPAVVLAGRTFYEWVATVVSFMVLAYLEEPWWGLAVAIAVGGIVPLYRIRYPRGYLLHRLWSLGLVFGKVGMFTLRSGTRVMGP